MDHGSPGAPDPFERHTSARIVGLHYVRIPVRDVVASKDWYVNVLGFEAIMDYEEEAGPVGVVLRDRQGFIVGLHQDPDRAAALRYFAVLGLAVGGGDSLEGWIQRLDALGLAHGPVEQGHLGVFIDVPDPDGILVRLHHGPDPDAEEA